MPLYRAELIAKKPSQTGALIHDLSQVLHLPFDYDDGSYARDRSGYGNDGTIYGPTLAAGIIGSARYFDAIDDYVEIPHSSSLNFLKAFTITAWVKPASDISWYWNKVYNKPLSNTTWVSPFLCYDLGLSWHTTGQPYSWVGHDDGTYDAVRSDRALVKGNPYFLAATYDAIAGKQRLFGAGDFADGSSGFFKLGERNVTKDISQRTTKSLIGRRGDYAAAEMVKGIIDEVHGFERALSEDEIHMVMHRRW